MGKGVQLPTDPKDKELEEYLTSYFQAVGYFTERNIIEREATEVLELDSILYDYSKGIPETNLVEIKSGGWGFPEIFKVLGWKHYLSIEKALFITSTSKCNNEINNYYIKKSKEIGVELSIIEKLDESPIVLLEYLKGKAVESIDILSWRFSYWTERKLVRKLITQKKSIKDVERYKIMAEYHHNINDVAFFTDNILDRLRTIYKQFQQHSGLTSRVANEMAGSGFTDGEIPKSIFSNTFYKCEINDLTTSSYLEYRSRLSIMKNVVDYIIYKKIDPKSPKACDTFKILGFTESKFSLLPMEMKERIDELSSHEYIHLYPIFWQWFMWVFGGFILRDYKEKEYELFSKKSGIPIDHIDKAFEAYNILFPTSSWFSSSSNSNIDVLKMFPTIFLGIGANYRKMLYTEDNEYTSLKLSGQYTLSDLIRWNNCIVEFLEKRDS